MFVIFCRTVLIYIILIGSMRLTGKRQIGELHLSELVTAFMLSDLAVMPITNINIPLLHAIFPIFILISLEIIVTFLVTKSTTLKKLFNGTPSILIYKGTLNQPELTKMRISMDEFIGELRLKNISDISEVEYAILEENGQLSVFPKTGAKHVTVEDLNLSPQNKGISHPLIIDGNINKSNLTALGKTEKWLKKRIAGRQYSIENIFYFAIDDAENETIILRDKNK